MAKIVKTEKDLYAEINWSGLEKHLTKFMGVKIKLTVSLEQKDKVPYFVSEELLDQGGIFQKFYKSILIESFDSKIDVPNNLYTTGVHVTYQMNIGGKLGSKISDAIYDLTAATWTFTDIVV